MAMTSTTMERAEQLRADPSLLETAAGHWLSVLAPEIAGLPRASVIVIDLIEGGYVVAADRLAALDAFEARFGAGRPGWLHQIGGNIVVGGSIV